MSTRVKPFSKLVLALAVGIFVGWALSLSYEPAQLASPPAFQPGQDRALPAAASPPKEIAELEQLQKQVPNPPGRGQAAGGIKALNAAGGPPPEIKQLQDQMGKVPEAPRGKPSVQQLEQILSRRPDAAAKMNNAKKGGRPSAENHNSWTPSWLDRLNPFRVLTALAQSGFDAYNDLTHSAANPHFNLSSNPMSTYVYGTSLGGYYGSSLFVYGDRQPLSLPDGTKSSGFVYSYASIPVSGYYIVSARINSYGPPIKLLNYTSSGLQLLNTFPAVSGWADYPDIFYLNQGYHYFYWVPSGPGSYFYFASANVRAYP